MDYRKEIDGLRALAIVPVVLFHSGLPIFSWGYIGVDIFFVISGFLITSIIYPKILAKEFSFFWFYENRIRRLFPALFLMIAVTSLTALFILEPIRLTEFAYSIFSSLFFYSNFFFWQEIDYFETNSDLMPLLHTWSLSIEEQFYIFFPIILIVLMRMIKNQILIIIAALCLVSFSLWVFGNIFFQTATFYLPITRAWELLAGAFLAIYIYHFGYPRSRIPSSIGLVILFISFYFFSLEIESKNLLMFLPVIGTLLILGFKNHYSFVILILENKIAIFLGLISYSLYLFHQPIFALAKIYFIDLEISLALFILGISILISFISWNYVEKFFRKRFNSKLSFSSTLAAISLPLILSLSLAIFFIKSDGNKISYISNLDTQQAKTYQLLEKVKIENEDDIYINNECIINSDDFSTDLVLKVLRCNSEYGPGVLFFGDSHAKDIFNSYQYLNKSKFIIGITANFCQGHSTIDHCYYYQLSDFLKTYPGIFEKIYFHQAGYFFLSHNNRKLNDKHSLENLALNDSSSSFKILKDRVKNLKNNLKIFPDNLVVIGPRIEPHIQNKYIKKYSCNHQYETRKNLDLAFISLDEYFKNSFSSQNYISLQKMTNFSVSKDFINCEEIYWSDGDHWSVAGEKRFSRFLSKL